MSENEKAPSLRHNTLRQLDTTSKKPTAMLSQLLTIRCRGRTTSHNAQYRYFTATSHNILSCLRNFIAIVVTVSNKTASHATKLIAGCVKLCERDSDRALCKIVLA